MIIFAVWSVEPFWMLESIYIFCCCCCISLSFSRSWVFRVRENWFHFFFRGHQTKKKFNRSTHKMCIFVDLVLYKSSVNLNKMPKRFLTKCTQTIWSWFNKAVVVFLFIALFFQASLMCFFFSCLFLFVYVWWTNFYDDNFGILELMEMRIWLWMNRNNNKLKFTTL